MILISLQAWLIHEISKRESISWDSCKRRTVSEISLVEMIEMLISTTKDRLKPHPTVGHERQPFKLILWHNQLVSKEAEIATMTKLKISDSWIITEALAQQQILSGHSIIQLWPHLLKLTIRAGSNQMLILLSRKLFQNDHLESSSFLTCKMLAKLWNQKTIQRLNLRASPEDLKRLSILLQFKMNSLNKMITLSERSKQSKRPQTLRCDSLNKVLENTTKT